MSPLSSVRTLFYVAGLLAVTMVSPAYSQHGGGGHGGGGHGGGGHGGGGHSSFGGHSGFGGHSSFRGHGYAGRAFGGHGYGGRLSGTHSGYGGHGGLDAHSGYGGHGASSAHSGDIGGGLGHGGLGHGGLGHGGLGHGGLGHGGLGHGGLGHGYGGHGGGHIGGFAYHDDSYPYYGWYPSFSASQYPWYGFYGADDVAVEVVVNRPVVIDGQVSALPGQAPVPNGLAVSVQGEQFRQQAEAAFRAGRFDEALRLANHALVEVPGDGQLLLFVSHALLATGDYRSAAAAIHQAAALLGKDDWGYVVKNWKNYYRGRGYTNAMDGLNEYVNKNPDKAYARFLRGYHFGFLGHTDFARKDMAKAIELESRDRLATELLALFSGETPVSPVDPSSENQTTEPESGQNGGGGHEHGAHEHGGAGHH